ncbi:hypothetical protein QZH41_014072, partial [Actinostola sp. cb2023]
PGALLAAMKDGASVNKAALQQVKFFFPQLLDVTCFSHTIDNVGKHSVEFRVLDTFAQYWVSMFSHSAAVRLAWKTKTGTAMRSYSPTRWWSKWETMKHGSSISESSVKNFMILSVPFVVPARLCCPVQVQQLHPTVASVEELRKFSFLDDDGIIQGLTAELPRYMAIADGTALETEEEKLLWWSRNGATLPNWSSAVKKVLLVQPSSASAERVFSLMKNFFGNQQDAALEETVEASVMLRYNQNQRRK